MEYTGVTIGIIGENGSGKGTFVKVLRKTLRSHRIRHRRFSAVLAKTLREWYLPVTRRNLQKMAVGMRNEFGPDALSRVMAEIAERDHRDRDRTKPPAVVLDGIRWLPDVRMFKKLPNPILCYITADPRVRFTRMKKRKEKKSEAFMTWKRFLREERAPNEVLIPHLGKRYADVSVLRNNGSKRKFLQLAEHVILQEILPQCTRGV